MAVLPPQKTEAHGLVACFIAGVCVGVLAMLAVTAGRRSAKEDAMSECVALLERAVRTGNQALEQALECHEVMHQLHHEVFEVPERKLTAVTTARR